MINEEELYKYLRQGMKQTEIAERFGVTRQAVNQFITRPVRKRRARMEMFGDIPYKGLRELMITTPGISVSYLSKTIFQTNSHTAHQRAYRLIKGETVLLSIEQMWRLIDLTGMTFEELFERDEEK